MTSHKVPPSPETRITEGLTGAPFPPSERVAFIYGVTFTDVEMNRASFDWFEAIGATFIDCRFRNSKFRAGFFGSNHTTVPETRFERCVFDRVRIDGRMQPGNARFEGCQFRGGTIRGWRSKHAEFVDCRFSGKLTDCWFMGSTELSMDPLRELNEFRGNDFSEADLINCQFDYGIDVLAQRWPSSPGYLILDRLHARVGAARAAVSVWPNDEDREYAIANLNIMAGESMGHQDVKVVRREDWLPWKPYLRDTFFALLEADPHPA